MSSYSRNFQAYLKLRKKGLGDKYVVFVRGNLIGKSKDIEKILSIAKKRCRDCVAILIG